MLLPPIIERELRIALQQHGAVKSRFRTAGMGVGAVSLFLLLGWLAGLGTRTGQHWGRTLHEILFYGGLYLAVIPSARISVGLFSEDRRNQTWELLYLAGITPGELFIGKLLGGTLIASCDLLALWPLLAVPFLSGGISLDLFLATIACLPVVLIFIIAVGTLASVICKDEGAAFVCAAVLVGVASLAIQLPYALGRSLTGAAPFSSGWLCLSPAYGPYLVGTHFGALKPGAFWATAAATVTWAILCLGMAALLLRRNWREDIGRSAPTGWQEMLRSWIQGSREWRLALRWRVLNQNPFQWLAQQDRRPVWLAWGIIAGVCLLWLRGWRTWRGYWPSTVNFYTTAFLLLLTVDTVMRHAAARRIGYDRRDGVLELLLTTPLTPDEIVDGQLAALKGQFRPVRHALLGLCIVMMLGGLLTRSWNAPALVSYFLIWSLFLGWCLRSYKGTVATAMWIALNSGRPTFAVLRRNGTNWWWLWNVYNLRYLARSIINKAAIRFPNGTAAELVLICCGAFGILVFLVIARLGTEAVEDLLVKEMRSIAQEPVPAANDPRFKKWKVNERLSAAV
jgi:hypothetical protein